MKKIWATPPALTPSRWNAAPRLVVDTRLWLSWPCRFALERLVEHCVQSREGIVSGSFAWNVITKYIDTMRSPTWVGFTLSPRCPAGKLDVCGVEDGFQLGCFLGGGRTRVGPWMDMCVRVRACTSVTLGVKQRELRHIFLRMFRNCNTQLFCGAVQNYVAPYPRPCLFLNADGCDHPLCQVIEDARHKRFEAFDHLETAALEAQDEDDE